MAKLAEQLAVLSKARWVVLLVAMSAMIAAPFVALSAVNLEVL